MPLSAPPEKFLLAKENRYTAPALVVVLPVAPSSKGAPTASRSPAAFSATAVPKRSFESSALTSTLLPPV